MHCVLYGILLVMPMHLFGFQCSKIKGHIALYWIGTIFSCLCAHLFSLFFIKRSPCTVFCLGTTFSCQKTYLGFSCCCFKSHFIALAYDYFLCLAHLGFSFREKGSHCIGDGLCTRGRTLRLSQHQENSGWVRNAQDI